MTMRLTCLKDWALKERYSLQNWMAANILPYTWMMMIPEILTTTKLHIMPFTMVYGNGLIF